MAKRIELELTPEQHADLVQMRDHDARPYMREKAAALLKVASGKSPNWVAHWGLLRAREPDTVYKWVRDYKAEPVVKARPATRRRFSPEGPGARGGPRAAEPSA
jgi:hypothetical protein